ncbi:MAG TPA: heterodisulfide reductase-related iron-sulfur binding cluster [Candidatus Binataceae bacterium]|nr:heterodisulfide reductase-related iron-sulfur binding cluster [Candidatus Binataceae bacterium]
MGSAPRANQAGGSASPGAIRDVVDYELLFDCVHCGLCLEACPTYTLNRAEMDSPRGRIYLMKALAQGALELDADVVRHLDLCLECRGCETACPSGVRYGQLIEKARVYVERNWRRSLRERIRNRLIGEIFPYPRRLDWLLMPMRLVDALGLRGTLERLAPAALRNWIELLPAARADAPRFPRAAAVHEDDGPGKAVAVHEGCVAQILTPSENANSARALEAAGYRVVRLERTVCCGALDIHNGNRKRALAFARQNVRELSRCGAEAIVSAASGCSAVIASYGELLREDPVWATAAREVSSRVTDLSSLMIAGRTPFTREFVAKVTYHDSCHLAHGLGIREAPRALLRSLPGVTLVELAEADLCCGSAGSYNLTEPEMARALAARKADNVVATGVDYVILSNPGCELQIAAELRRRGSKIRVMHLADFLALAAGGGEARGAR